MKQFALKKNGRMVAGSVRATKSDCWFVASEEIWPIITPLHCDAGVVKRCREAGYEVIPVDVEPVGVKRKARLFDWLAKRLDEAKLQLSFGGSDWIYPECDPAALEDAIIKARGFEKEEE